MIQGLQFLDGHVDMHSWPPLVSTARRFRPGRRSDDQPLVSNRGWISASPLAGLGLDAMPHRDFMWATAKIKNSRADVTDGHRIPYII